MGVKVTAFFTT